MILEQLQVPMRRVTVQVHTSDGLHVDGWIFLAESPHCRGGPADVVDALNDDRSFIPFCAENPPVGKSILNKAHIIRVHLDATRDELSDPFPGSPESHESCTVQLADGTHLHGHIFTVTPPNGSRIVDKLNHASRFVSIVSDCGIDFVHGAHVVRVS